MKAHSVKSILLHIVTICCFCTPFYLNTCSVFREKKTEEAAIDSTAFATDAVVVADSTFQSTSIEPSNDSINNVIIFKMDSVEIAKNDSIQKTKPEEDKKELLSEYISRNYPFFKPILIPNDEVFTGLASSIDALKYISYFACFISLLFLFLSLTIKLVDENAKLSIVIIESLALIILASSKLISFDFDYLWGFWLTLFLILALLCYDIFILNKLNPKKSDRT